MDIIGIGTDIIEIARFEALSERFLKRCFTEAERAYAREKPETLSGLFAAKEAVVKAMGTGFTGFMPDDIEITRNARGKPEVTLHKKAREAAEAAGIVRIEVSISHNKTAALGFAAALGSYE
jgi:holo-[acyl-carrier protein] synthase